MQMLRAILAKRIVKSTLVALTLLALTACGQNMSDGSRFEPYEPEESTDTVFPFGQVNRPLVENTVARGNLRDDEHFYTGEIDGEDATTFPIEVTENVIARGQERYNVFCAPCHATDGYGRGMIVQRGFPQPPSFHDERLRNAPVGYYFDVITNGFGVMYPYGYRVPPSDRWAIIAYIRALQLSQNASIDDVPAEERQKLQEGQK